MSPGEAMAAVWLRPVMPTATPELLVAGGVFLDAVEIFNFHTQSWRSGPVLNAPKAYMGSAQYGDKFLLIGGDNYVTGDFYDEILEFDAPPGVGWVVRDCLLYTSPSPRDS